MNNPFFTATTNRWTEVVTVRCPSRWRLADDEWDHCEERFDVHVRFTRDPASPGGLDVELLDFFTGVVCPGCLARRREQRDEILELAEDERHFEYSDEDRVVYAEPIELALCEYTFVVLKPDTPYVFRVNPDCAECRRLAGVYGYTFYGKEAHHGAVR